MKTTTSSVTPISENPKQPQPRQTAKEVIAANVKSLIEQLEAGHSDALTAYLDAMSRFHNYSFGNILEIARQRPDATRVAGMYAWNQLGRKVKKGERGIRILAPIVGVKRKKDEEAEKDITKQNTRVLVGFRNAYVFDVSQTEGAELPAMREMSGEVGENRARLISFINKHNIELVFTENIAPALGVSYGGRIAILPGQSEAEEFSTLVHELAHEMLHKAERRSAECRAALRPQSSLSSAPRGIAFFPMQVICLLFLNLGEMALEPSLPLGIDPDADYLDRPVVLNNDDHLTLYTDGVLEATNSAGELYGFERVTALLADHPDAEFIANTARVFGQEDDITVLTITRHRVNGTVQATSVSVAA